MKKIILVGLLAFILALAVRIEPADLGVNNLMNEGRGDIDTDTIAPAGTLFTAVYAVDATRGMSSFTSMFVKLDTIQDSIYCVIKLQESWDEGATWELTTTVCSIRTTAAYIDTGFDVDLYPAPFFRFILNNIGDTEDSISVEDAIFYNHPGE